MEKYLAILEVSQKQAYIFKSKKLEGNILNSAVIAHALSYDYIQEVLKEFGYSDEKNMVYSGGGHTILEFENKDQARNLISKLTYKIYCDFDELEVFAKIVKYNENISPSKNLYELSKQLENKKSIRKAAFKQGSFGIEEIDSNTLDVKIDEKLDKERNDRSYRDELKEKEKHHTNKKYTPEGFSSVLKFENLGGTKNENNFISVVHIDGNGMGKRVENLYEKYGSSEWNEFKKKIRDFSENIDRDFKEAFVEMTKVVGDSITNGSLKDKLSLSGREGKTYFPIRRIITAGDDICFVTEGRIGIECARIFIEKLCAKKNKIDNKYYSACAGVAIVHQKYPFYKAYEIAELLCSSAKRYGAKISEGDNGSSVSSIDWHIEFGEVKDSLDEIRRDYETYDGNRLELRPYIIRADESILKNKENHFKLYPNFRKIIISLNNDKEKYGIGKVKELRGALKEGLTATSNYLKFNRMENIIDNTSVIGKEISKDDLEKIGSGNKVMYDSFIKIPADEKLHCILFDSIELIDTFLEITDGGNENGN